jgi:hypothetical protein
MTLRYCDADTAWLVDRDAFGVPWLVKIGIGR